MINTYNALLSQLLSLSLDDITTDDIAFDGPLAKYVASAWVELLTSFHRWNEWVLLALVVVHVGAIYLHRNMFFDTRYASTVNQYHYLSYRDN